MDLTVETLKQAYPDIHAAILREGHTAGYTEGLAKGTEEGFKSGAEKERARIKGIEEGALPGHEALVAQMKWDGTTTPEQAAVKILGAEKTLRETKLAEFKTDAPPVIPAADAAKDAPKQIEKTDGPMSEEQMKAVWNRDANLRAEYGDSFEAYRAYMEAEQKGLVKIYKGGK